MLLEIPSCDTHFFLQVRAYNRRLVQTAALDQDKNLFQIHGKQCLVANPAGLQFQNHFFEQITIGRGVSCVKHIVVHRNIMPFQNAADLSSGKMNPVYLWFILAEIFIMHFLLRLVKHHVTGSNDHFLTFDVKVRLSGSHIQKLPVGTTAAPPCGQFIVAA